MDDVAQMEADAERDPPLGRQVHVALGHAPLDFAGAAQGVDQAGELGQEAVAR